MSDDQLVAAGIIRMLRDNLERLPNTRTDSALTSFERNAKAPGIWHAIEVIEAAYKIERERK